MWHREDGPFCFFEKGFIGTGLSREIIMGGLITPHPRDKTEEALEIFGSV